MNDSSYNTASRREQVMSAISRREEMLLPLNEIRYSPILPLPQKSKCLRSLASLFSFDFPGFTGIMRRLILGKLPGLVNSSIEPGFRCFYGNICAEGVSLCDTRLIDYAPIYIGRGTGFSFDNIIITSTHNLNDFKEVTASEVIIGENVWITSRCIILGGVRIGHNSVIAAGSVVTSDIPPNVTAGGVPARVISNNFRR